MIDIENIIAFLRDKGWEEVAATKGVKFISPREIQVSPEIVINIPRSDKLVDFDRFSRSIIETLSDLYSISISELNELFSSSSPTIFSIRINDFDSQSGKIALEKFEDLMKSLKQILIDTADFVVRGDNRFAKKTAEAKTYLNNCNFLQTEKGSFVAKVELPDKLTIKDEDVFDPQAVNAFQVNRKIQDILFFINEEIFLKEIKDDIDEKYIQTYKEVLNLKILKDFEELYAKTNIQNIDYNLKTVSTSSTIVTQNINREKITILKEFIESTKKIMLGEKNIEMTGTIIKLESKNPDGFRNHIVVIGQTKQLKPIKVSASLKSLDYKLALDLHKRKKLVHLKGIAKEEQTQYRMSLLKEFKEA